jgi:hypothetical protein
MADLMDVDTSEAAELSDFSPIPPAEYTAYVDSSERKTTKAGDGQYLSTSWIIHGGLYDGRKLFHNFNLWNKNETAVSIAKSEWRAVCENTVNKPSVSNSEDVHHKKVTISVALEQGKDGKARNTILFRKDKIRPFSANSVSKKTEEKSGSGSTKKTPWG